MKFLYLMLFASIGAHAASSFVLGKDLISAVDAHSRAANLHPLKSSGDNELRVWAHSYMSGRITGYVVASDGAITCHTKYRYADESITIDRAKCRPWHSGQNLLAELGTISALNGKEWDCPMHDGGGFYIEGVHDGSRFALSVSNPHACDDADSKAVITLLDNL